MELTVEKAQVSANKEKRPYAIFLHMNGEERKYYEKPLDDIQFGEPGLAIKIVMPKHEEATS
jgi:hypothetical protein